MRQTTLAVAVVFVALASAVGQDGAAGGRGSGRSMKTGITRAELVRSWDLDGDGSISQSEADIARARMRRQRAEMHLESGMDPVTGLPRGEAPLLPEPEEEPRYQLPPDLPTPEPEDAANQDATGKPKSTRPKPMAELLAPIPTTDPVPGLPRMPNLTGKPTDPPAGAPPERSGRASWLPPTKTSTTGVGGPRAGAPPAVTGYGSDAWSDLNAGRLRAMPHETKRSPSTTGSTPTTGGGLLPTVRKPGQTGALILPGTQDSRLAPTTPAVPTTPRIPTFSPPRVTAEDIGGYGP